MKRWMSILTVIATLCMLHMPVLALDVPDSVDGYYLDDANVLSAETKAYITEKNSLMDDHCGGYIEVVTQPYIRCDVADYSYALFNQWEIGGKQNNGILLVLVPEEDTYYLMYGTGLEDRVPVYEFQNIIDTYFADAFEAGNYDLAVRNTFDALYRVLEDTYGSPSIPITSPKPAAQHGGAGMETIILLIVILVIVFLLAFCMRNTRRRPRGWVAPPRRHRPHRPRPHAPRRAWRPSTYEHSYREPHRHREPSRPSSHRTSSSRPSRSSAGSSFGGAARSVRSSGGRTRGSGVGKR